MRWALTQSTSQLHWWKLEQGEFNIELKYSKTAHSFRLKADDKRLFFIEKTGFLQQRFLLRTEYSVVTGEVLPVKNWHSGIINFENRKYHYFLKGNQLRVISKKENLSLTIEVEATGFDQFELGALLFGTIRTLSKIREASPLTAA